MAPLWILAPIREDLANRPLSNARSRKSTVILEPRPHSKILENPAVVLESVPHERPAEAGKVVVVEALVEGRRYVVAQVDVTVEPPGAVLLSQIRRLPFAPVSGKR